MFDAVDSSYLVPFDGQFKIAKSPTLPPPDVVPNKQLKRDLEARVEELAELQNKLYAHDKHSILLIFQAIDAAGKDSTIRKVLSGVDPAGCQVFSFKQPSSEELQHDFLWRCSRCLPERGRIGVFNRSYYEEVLVVRVHPEYLQYQSLPYPVDKKRIWQHRFEAIRDYEKHLARSGTIVLKFWLNVSKEEQRQRFLSRLNEPEKHWKFAAGDVREREFWAQYMEAYQEALAETSRSWAPWYAIPADNKRYMRDCVAKIVTKSLKSLDLKYPTVAKDDQARFKVMRKQLEDEV